MGLDKHRVELRVGETLWVGQHQVTVIDIDGEEVTFRVNDSTVSEPTDAVVRPR